MTCIITGCRLVISYGNKSSWGDLHRDFGVYIFNRGQCPWEYGRWADKEERAVSIKPGVKYIEVGNVVICADYHAELNLEAERYLHE